MKKFVIFLIFVVIIICAISYCYITYNANYKIAKKQNMLFEEYLGKEIYGADLVTVMNRAMDSNAKNEVQKNKNGTYQDNEKNSISIKIKMLDNEKIYPMEAFYQEGIETFIQYYNKIKFKCMDLQYHENTHKVKSLYFEQITS